MKEESKKELLELSPWEVVEILKEYVSTHEGDFTMVDLSQSLSSNEEAFIKLFQASKEWY